VIQLVNLDVGTVSVSSTDLRRCGVAAIVGAALAIAGNAWLLVTHPSVPHSKLSWPLSPSAYVAMQVFFALTQVLLAAGIFGLTGSDVVTSSRASRGFSWLARVGMTLTVPGELVLILVRGQNADASSVDALSSVFGLGVLLADVGLIGFGVLALRQRNWPSSRAVLPLALGVFQLLVVTPVSFAAGFSSVASNVAIGIADALTALIGVGLLTRPAPASTSPADQRVPA
jgi:hypothetical protein